MEVTVTIPSGKEFPASSACQHVVLCVVGCTRVTLMYSMCSSRFPFWCGLCESVYMEVNQDEHWVCTESTFLLISTQNPRVHSKVHRTADCRSAGPLFNSGWRSWIHTHWHIQRNILMSPITTTVTMPITTIPGKSVNIF